MDKPTVERKGCPLLVQSETNPSLTMAGQSWTRTWFLDCSGPACAAWDEVTHECNRFGTCVDIQKEDKDG